MNIRNVKKPDARVNVGYLASLGIKTYGVNNLYPNEIARIVRASSTGGACVDRYARFIEGGGFAFDDVASIEVDRIGTTANDLLAGVAHDLALYGGFALHIKYNAFLKIAGVSLIPFDNVRLCECDDAGYIGSVAVYDDWTGKRTKNGKQIKPSPKNVLKYPIFNPRPDVLRAQINAVGGIENYGGQVLYFGAYGRAEYPTPKADRVITDLSTDEGLSNIKLRNTRNNFLPASMVVTRESQTSPDDVFAGEGFAENLELFQGDEASNNILQVTITSDEEKPEIVEFPVKNYDKDFEVTDTSVVERIYCAYEQEPFLAVRNGRLGFSGSVVRDAYAYYSSLVAKEQKAIARTFGKIFALWHTGETFNEAVIKPLIFVSND